MSYIILLTEELKGTLAVLARKDRQLALEVNKKIKQVAASDEFAIEHYKNLKYGLRDYKRVHVGKSFVLFFRVVREEGKIIFDRLMHHDDAYRR